jgi:hypothetical protein
MRNSKGMKRCAVNVPMYWLERAKNARKAAERTNDRKVRDTMLGFADGYEKMAKRVENPRATM